MKFCCAPGILSSGDHDVVRRRPSTVHLKASLRYAALPVAADVRVSSSTTDKRHSCTEVLRAGETAHLRPSGPAAGQLNAQASSKPDSSSCHIGEGSVQQSM